MNPRQIELSFSSSGSEILEGLNRLYKEGDRDFWHEYIQHLSNLCKAPWAMLLEFKENTWVPILVGATSEVKAMEDQLLPQIQNLLEKLEGRDLVYEPSLKPVLGLEQPFLLCLRVEARVLVLVLEHLDEARFNEMVVRTQLVKQIPWVRGKGSPLGEKLLDTLKVLDVVVACKQFKLAAMTLVNELVLRFRVSRVSLGWNKGSYIETIAISQLEDFDHHSSVVRELHQLFEEVVDQEKAVVVPTTEEGLVYHQHHKFLQSRDLKQVFSFPLQVDGVVVGVITFESSDWVIEQHELDLAQITAAQVAPWLESLRLSERWVHRRAWDGLQNWGRWAMGPRHTMSKVIALGLFLCFILSLTLKGTFHLEATGMLETDQVAVLSAPFNGFLKHVHQHSGDVVKAGDVLLSMDREELEFKELEEQAKVLRFNREIEKSRSERDLVSVKVSQARVAQSEAELARIRYYLDQATMKAPFDSIVVEGDREDLLGAPVTKGDLLMKMVQPTDLYLTFKLEERDIDHLELNMEGDLVLLSQPGMQHRVKVERIIPLAQADEVGNIFRVKASLLNPSLDWWRPGMSGVVKLEVGQRTYLWLALHRTIDAIRYFLWL